MKWIAIAVGVIVAIVLLIVMIGSLLPRDHVATVSARISAPPANVWALITQPDGFTSWRSDLTRSRRSQRPAGIVARAQPERSDDDGHRAPSRPGGW
jgi:hypothetical protein